MRKCGGKQKRQNACCACKSGVKTHGYLTSKLETHNEMRPAAGCLHYSSHAPSLQPISRRSVYFPCNLKQFGNCPFSA